MPKNYEVSGPAFVALLVRDVAVSAEFYATQLGFRRDPEVSPGAVAARMVDTNPRRVMHNNISYT